MSSFTPKGSSAFGGVIYKQRNALPRAFVVPLDRHENLSETLQRLEQERPQEIQNMAIGTTELHYPDSDTATLTVSVPTRGLAVLLLDRFYPGWQAFDNQGREKPILQIFGGMRAVDLPQGETMLHFKFLPGTFLFGLGLSLMTLFSLSLFIPFSLWFFRPGVTAKGIIPNN
jgi:hypothetical protein